MNNYGENVWQRKQKKREMIINVLQDNKGAKGKMPYANELIGSILPIALLVL